MGEPAVDMEDVFFARPGGAFSMRVERFALAAGEHVLLTAPSGAGKSTLIGLIAGILQPQRGAIRIAGTDIVPLSASRRDFYRAENIGLIFQDFNLIPYLSTLDNILLPLSFAPARLRGLGGRARARTVAEDMLDAIDLPARQYGRRKAGRLSIGQQQRVAVLRALIGGPPLLVADEPTSALDRDRQQAFLAMLKAQTAQSGSSLIMVSHDLSLAPLFDRTVALDSFAGTERAA